MHPELPLDAVLVAPRSARVLRATVLGAGFDLVGECDDVTDGLVLAALYRPAVVVVAATAPGATPTSTAELRDAAGGAPVVVVAVEDDPGLVDALRAARLTAGAPADRRADQERRREQDWSRVTFERRAWDGRCETARSPLADAADGTPHRP
jgi:hypothetical protein